MLQRKIFAPTAHSAAIKISSRAWQENQKAARRHFVEAHQARKKGRSGQRTAQV
jgi:hypothetical protein